VLSRRNRSCENLAWIFLAAPAIARAEFPDERAFARTDNSRYRPVSISNVAHRLESLSKLNAALRVPRARPSERPEARSEEMRVELSYLIASRVMGKVILAGSPQPRYVKGRKRKDERDDLPRSDLTNGRYSAPPSRRKPD